MFKTQLKLIWKFPSKVTPPSKPIIISGFSITSETKNVLETINPIKVHFTCHFQQNLCSPGQYLQTIAQKEDGSFQMKQLFFKNIMNIIRNDASCLVIEFIDENIKLATQKRLVCIQTNHKDIIEKLN